MQTGDGHEYGPVSKQELDQWAADERIDADCQILQEGWNQWKWAEDVYPALAVGGQASEANPFAGIGESAPTASGNPFAAIAESNPYASPQVAGASAVHSGDAGEAVTQKVVRYMDGTRPWLLLFCVLAFIVAGFAGLVIVFGIIMLFAVPIAGLIMMLTYGTLAGIYGYIGFLLLKYSKAMNRLVRSGKVSDLEKTIEAQRNFWKTVGILTIVMIALMMLMWALMFAGAMAGVSAASSAGTPPWAR